MEQRTGAQRARVFRVIGWAMVLGIWFLSLGPAAGPDLPIPDADKWGHGLAYAVVTWWWGMLHPRPSTRWLLCGAFAGMGVALEFAQSFTDYRTFDSMDMAANAAGALAGRLAVETRIGRLLQTSSTPTRASRSLRS